MLACIFPTAAEVVPLFWISGVLLMDFNNLDGNQMLSGRSVRIIYYIFAIVRFSTENRDFYRLIDKEC